MDQNEVEAMLKELPSTERTVAVPLDPGKMRESMAVELRSCKLLKADEALPEKTLVGPSAVGCRLPLLGPGIVWFELRSGGVKEAMAVFGAKRNACWRLEEQAILRVAENDLERDKAIGRKRNFDVLTADVYE
jgi:hypothetical protein